MNANWTNLLVIFHVVVALGIIGLVLLQHGKGAEMGSGFGSGASGSLFGATGSANFLSRTTAVLATVFFLLSLALTYMATQRPQASGSILDRAPAEQQQKTEPQKTEPQKPAAAPEKSTPPANEKSVPQ